MIKSVLVSHSAPVDDNSPYHVLAREWDLRFDFKDFVITKGLTASEFRKQNINILNYSGVIFTGRNAVDYFFTICRDLRIELPPEKKYFCASETIAKYLQKYITIRKRKLFVGERTTQDLIEILKKHPKEQLLYPCSEVKSKFTDQLEEAGIKIKPTIVFQMEAMDLSDVASKQYDMICFFSPPGIDAFKTNFPGFVQNDTLIAVYGDNTAQACEQAGFRLDIKAPLPDAPSLTTAIENYLKKISNV